MYFGFFLGFALFVVWRIARDIGWASVLCTALALPALAGSWLTFIFPDTDILALPLLVLGLIMGGLAISFANGRSGHDRSTSRFRERRRRPQPRREPTLARR